MGDDIQFVNNLTYGAGEVGQALVFDGTGAYGIVPASSDIDLGASTAGFTVEFWINVADATRSTPVLQWALSGQASGLSIGIQSKGNMQSQVNASMQSSSGTGASFSAPVTLTQGTWNHVAFSYDRTTGAGAFYINGILTSQAVGAILRVNTGLSLAFGHNFSGGPGGTLFAGSLDEVSLYTRPLSGAEILGIYQEGTNGKSPVGTVAPTVNAGPDLALSSVSKSATLAGTAALGSSPGPLTVAWTMLNGPGTTTFANPTAAATTATFSTPGLYVLELDASDGLSAAIPSRLVVRVGEAYPNPDPTGLVDWWPLNAEPHEVVHGDHDVQFINTLRYGPGKVGMGLVFDGVSGYGDVPASPDLDLGTSTAGFTIEFWVNVADTTHTAPVLEWGTVGKNALSINVQNVGGQQSRLNATMQDASGQGNSTSASTTITQGTWNHVAFTYDKTTGAQTFYVNGVLSSQSVGNVVTVIEGFDLVIGKDVSGGVNGSLFDGSLDEISLYNRPLTSADIVGIYREGAAGKSPYGSVSPTVYAGADLSIAGVSSVAPLNGIATAGSGPGPLTIAWSLLSGPGVVTFANAASPTTTATFSNPGVYVLELDANDGLNAAPPGRVVVRVGESYTTALPSGTADWWPLNGEPHEVINGNHDVQFINTLAYGPGEVGLGLVFDGVSGYGVVPASPDLDIGNSAAGFSMEFWVNVADSTRNTPVLEWGAPGKNALSINLQPNGAQQSRLDVTMQNTSGQGNNFTSSQVTVAQGVWTHVAFTYDKTTGTGDFYINGVGAGSSVGSVVTPISGLNLVMGQDVAGGLGGQLFAGSLDEVTLYTVPLTAAQVAQLFASGVAGKPPITVNQAPVVAVPSTYSGYVGIPINLAAVAVDDGLPNPPALLTYEWSSISGPAIPTFGNPAGLNTTATFGEAGTYVVEFQASDSVLSASAETTVTVTTPPSLPAVAITAPAPNANVAAGAPFTITATATDTGGTIAKVDFYNGAVLLGTAPGPEVGMPTTYFLNVSGLAVGSYTLTAIATDNNGVTATSAPVNFNVITVTGGLYLNVVTPMNGDNIGNVVAVTGVISGQTLLSWTASYRLMVNQGQSPNPWVPFATGTGMIGAPGATPAADNPGTIGSFDPTLLLNGLYEIQVAATDTSANTTVDGPIDVVVEGNAKIGQFTLAFNDLSIPAPGIPITITRTYDSRDTRIGDFGPGWFIGVDDIRIQKNSVIGADWFQTQINPLAPIQFYYLTPDNEKIVSVTMPDGTDYRFMAGAFIRDPDRSGDPDDASLSTVDAGKLKFYPIGDTVGTLQPLDSNNAVDDTYLVLSSGDTELDTDDGTALYDPTRFLLTTKDGTAYVLDQNQGLLKVTDLSGNTLVLNRDSHGNLVSIVSTQNAPSGPIVSTVNIHHSAAGPIDTITDLAGKNLTYAYDTRGRLASFTDRSSNVTQFLYANAAFPDYLTSVVDPLGNQAIRTVYDSSGRLTEQIDANGKVTQFAPGADVTGNYETITDRLGNSTKNYYDNQGNVVLKIDALSGQTQYTFDANNDQTSVTDPLGHKSTMTYDSQKNLLTQVDPLGNTTTYTYDSQSRPLTITDALGHVTTNTYDGSGNLTQTSDAAGNSTALTYDAAGDLLTSTDALGHITTNAYDGNGNLTQTTDALGHATTYTYDANRNRLTQAAVRTRADGSTETDTTTYGYDASNRVILTTYPDGSTSQVAYNPIGKQASTTDGLGHVTSYTYDADGNLTLTTQADGTADAASYDADGNAVTATDRGGHTTTTTYDPLNRATVVIYADSSITATAYDAAGRVTSSTDALGHVTTFGYDASGRRTSVKDALGNTSTSSYDADGNLLSVLDALGHNTTYTYDALNRRTLTTFADATTQATAFDALGRKASATDQMGVVTQYGYDALGRLISVTQAPTPSLPAALTSYAYDELGHEISQADALSHITRYSYDALGRRTGRTLPAGQSESYVYDEAGNLGSHRDFNGYQTTFHYDAENRMTEKDADPGHPSLSHSFAPAKMTYTYNAMGQRSTAATISSGGTTLYSETLSYDNRNRVLSKARTVNALGSSSDTLTYAYDAQGNLSSIKSGNAQGIDLAYGYDTLNRLQSVSTNDQQAGARKVTDYIYDNVGNLNSVTLPNNVTSLYTYDTLNRLTVLDVSLGGGAAMTRYAYTLNANGQRTQVAELNGRTTTYAYDTRQRLTQESVVAGMLDPAPGGTVNYTLDQVGNRVSSTSSLAGVSSQSNSFDPDDRLGSDTYDANGSTTAATLNAAPVIDAYDFESHLISRNSGAVQIAYDCDGNRIAKTVGAQTTTTFLVDTNNPTGYAQVFEEKVNGSLVRTYAYGTGLLSEGQFSGSTWKTSYYAFDGHGSTRFLSDATGTATDFYTYDAFGNLIQKSGTTTNAYLFSGEQFDGDLVLYFLRARYMEPARGRFWSQDDYEGAPDDPASLHKYLFCNGDPADGRDPSGNDTLGEVAIAGAISGSLDLSIAIVQIARDPNNLTLNQVAAKLGTSFAKGFATGVVGGVVGKVFIRVVGPGISLLGQKIVEGAAGSFGVQLGMELFDFMDGKPITVKTGGRIIVATVFGAGFGGLSCNIQLYGLRTRTPNIFLPWLEVTEEEIRRGMVAGSVGAETGHKVIEEWVKDGLLLNGEN